MSSCVGGILFCVDDLEGVTRFGMYVIALIPYEVSV